MSANGVQSHLSKEYNPETVYVCRTNREGKQEYSEHYVLNADNFLAKAQEGAKLVGASVVRVSEDTYRRAVAPAARGWDS